MQNKKLEITLSRTTPLFLEKLLEAEIPEIQDELIIIKKVVRRPGEKAKVAIAACDELIEKPIGACIGIKGTRIRNVMREVCNEQIDIIDYTDNTTLYLRRALKPAEINRIKENEDNTITIYLHPEQIGLAIGEKGKNISLASQLIGKPIKVYKDLHDDIHIEEFANEIPLPIIDTLKQIGLETAKSVLQITKEELKQQTNLDTKTIETVLHKLTNTIAQIKPKPLSP